MIHLGEYPYHCEHCGNGFGSIYREKLNKHVRIHTGEKPYMCSLCRKCFNQRVSLVSHERTHSGRSCILVEHVIKGLHRVVGGIVMKRECMGWCLLKIITKRIERNLNWWKTIFYHFKAIKIIYMVGKEEEFEKVLPGKGWYIWKEIFEFGGKLCLFVHTHTHTHTPTHTPPTPHTHTHTHKKYIYLKSKKWWLASQEINLFVCLFAAWVVCLLGCLFVYFFHLWS